MSARVAKSVQIPHELRNIPYMYGVEKIRGVPWGLE
jgi:hypothetical protein